MNFNTSIFAFLSALVPLSASAAATAHHATPKPKGHVAMPSSAVKIVMPGDLAYAYKSGPG